VVDKKLKSGNWGLELLALPLWVSAMLGALSKLSLNAHFHPESDNFALFSG
jgi:hypothetical protein